ncbi:hypothetical protein HK12_03385 [Acetobacter orientalis]|uniref:Uncharacterized protein n=1 Tax=Acetobacter orientalis TaxID=146474 RepID=A0A252A723_9PROT|nr:hypothetical protein HK12_03385 [Acetobacter orientalis]
MRKIERGHGAVLAEHSGFLQRLYWSGREKNTAPKTTKGQQSLQRVTAKTTPPHKAYMQPAL